jgi:hypothetical protein
MVPRRLFDFTAGLGLALVACGGILAERLTRGDRVIGVVGNALLTVVVIAILELRPRLGDTGRADADADARVAAGVALGAAPGARSRASDLALPLLGAGAGIALAHSLFRSSPLASCPWISERPAQLVNDAVAVFAPLAILWAATRRPPSTAVLVATLLVVTAYRATGFMWHFDAARFTYTVQDFVTGELAGSAVAVTTFRLLVPA